MTRRLGTCLLGLVFLVAAVASVGTLGVPTAAQSDGGPQPLTTPEGFDGTVFRITVYENTSAKWTVQHSRVLNDSEIADFEAFAEDFRTQETATYRRFQSRARNLTAFGERVTDREMAATSFSRDASVVELGQTRGAIQMSFVWSNFGQPDGERVRVGDIFQGGMYIADGQRLVVQRGPSLAFAEVQPDPDSMTQQGDLAASESVTWVGEVRFNDQRPAAVFQPRGAASASEGGGGTGSNTATADQSESAGGGMMPVLLGGGVLLLLLAGGVAWYAGYVPARGVGEILDRGDDSPADAGASRTETAASPSAGATAGAGGAAAQVQQEELLSDEDRVLQLIDENGGRMKQVAIVEETEWSKSKVSMLLSDMEEEGHISKLRLGRENIISLAGQEPDAAGSPFEDE